MDGFRKVTMKSVGYEIDIFISTTGNVNITGCHHALPYDIMSATNMMINDKRALESGYINVDKGCAVALCGADARVLSTKIEPSSALQPYTEGFEVATIESVASEMVIFTSAPDYFYIVPLPMDRSTRTAPSEETAALVDDNVKDLFKKTLPSASGRRT
eukprot:148573-Heterocapsa_arctica.AAC.1